MIKNNNTPLQYLWIRNSEGRLSRMILIVPELEAGAELLVAFSSKIAPIGS